MEFKRKIGLILLVVLLVGSSILAAVLVLRNANSTEIADHGIHADLNNILESLSTKDYDYDHDHAHEYSGHSEQEPLLFVLSFDGFKPEYLNATDTPTLLKLSQLGVRSTAMRSMYATKTFPNHFSIMTGLTEESHGLVSAEMWDPTANETISAATDKRAYTSGPACPIWELNELVSPHRSSGVMMWSGAPMGSICPESVRGTFQKKSGKEEVDHLRKYDTKMDLSRRVDEVMSWIVKRDGSKAANAVFIYTELPDQTAHVNGAWGRETLEKVRQVDRMMAYLLSRLFDAGLLARSNFIVLSDHGMADINVDRVVILKDVLPPSIFSHFRLFGESPVWSVWPDAGYEDVVYAALKNISRDRHFTIYKRSEIPARFHYSTHERIGPFFIEADLGWDLFSSENWHDGLGSDVWGNHGWDNELPEMKPLFIGFGPDFKRRYVHENKFHNTDLYPLMLHLLQVPQELTDKLTFNGTLDSVQDMLYDN